MTPVKFPEANSLYGPPEGMDDSQVGRIYVCHGKNTGGNLDGTEFTVTAWQPSEEEVERIKNGSPIFLTILWEGLPPHLITTSFKDAVSF